MAQDKEVDSLSSVLVITRGRVKSLVSLFAYPDRLLTVVHHIALYCNAHAM